MYGTIARAKVKSGALEALQSIAEAETERAPGYVAQYVYQMDDDPNELYIAVIFESKEAYVANAQSPEQHARFEKMMECFTAEPEWHDGEIVFTDQIQ
jgi:quinol monooxygenase YgiN